VKPPLFPVLAQAGGGILAFFGTMQGPDFLGLYLGWFFLTRLTVMFLRHFGHDTTATTLIGLVCYELLAVARIIAGTAHGLHRWGFLIAMMVVGGLIFFLRAEHLKKGDGSSWITSCGTGSSCSGGGGCGGGGCGGGCGGCGG
jgi:hypothetical protein